MQQGLPPNTDDLIGLATAGDRAAMSRLLIEHYPKLAARVEQRLPIDLKTVIAAEDILQDAFGDAFARIDTFSPQGEDAFYRWMASIAENRMIDAVRAQKAAKRGGDWKRVSAGAAGRSSIACLVDLVTASDRTPSRSAGSHEAAAAVQVGLAALRPEYREAYRCVISRGCLSPMSRHGLARRNRRFTSSAAADCRGCGRRWARHPSI
jgi:RNA polymerase sigma factor (sigma-70 family)